MPLYRRLPKLRGIAGGAFVACDELFCGACRGNSPLIIKLCTLKLSGMGAGLPDFVVVNLGDLEKHFDAGADVSLESIKAKVLSVSGREAKLPLKVCRLQLAGIGRSL